MQMIFENLDRIIGPPIFSMIYLLIGYSYMRMVRRGLALSQFQRGLLLYAGLFTLGLGYAIAWRQQLAELLRWEQAWIGLVIIWGVLLGLKAWSKRRHRSSAQA
jgi:hypothetical protein